MSGSRDESTGALCAQTTASALLRLFPLLFFDVARSAVVHRGTDAPDDRERLLPVLPMLVAQLEAGFIEAAALLTNCFNYAIGKSYSRTNL